MLFSFKKLIVKFAWCIYIISLVVLGINLYNVWKDESRMVQFTNKDVLNNKLSGNMLANGEKQIKVYIYPLESKFNYDIVGHYAKRHPEILLNNALGEPINEIGNEFVMNTDQFALEIYFYERLLNSTYFTPDYNKADIYYYPFFANHVHISGRPNGPLLYTKFWGTIRNDTRIYKNPKKHFMIFGGCEQFAVFLKKTQKIPNFSMIMLERLYTNSSVIVAPYPSQIHFGENGRYEIDYTKKDLFASSAWNSRYPLRGQLANLCKKMKNCSHYEFYKKPNLTYIYEQTSRSVFCLSPPGDTNTRKAFWDALMVGCINVIYIKIKQPFDDKIDYSKMTIYIPEHRAGKTFEILKAIPEEKIKAIQQYIEEHRVHLQYYILPKDYSNLPKQKDAFDMLIQELYYNSLNGTGSITI